MHIGRARMCLFIGTGCILTALAALAMENYGQDRLLASIQSAERQLAEETLAEEVLQTGSSKDNAAESNSENAAGREGKTETIESGALIGKLEISSISLEVPIREGSDKTSLKDAVGHLKGTAPIGDAYGNCCIAGHRNYSFGRFFNRLNEVQEGDAVILTDQNGMEYTYIVSSATVVKPEELSVLEPLEGGELTLITCTPLFLATDRLVVSCKLAEK